MVLKSQAKVASTFGTSGWFHIRTVTTNEAIGAGSRPGAAQGGLASIDCVHSGGFSHCCPNSSLGSGKYSRKDRSPNDLHQTCTNKRGLRPAHPQGSVGRAAGLETGQSNCGGSSSYSEVSPLLDRGISSQFLPFLARRLGELGLMGS